MNRPIRSKSLPLSFFGAKWVSSVAFIGGALPGAMVCSPGTIQAQPLKADITAQFSRVFSNREDPQRPEKLMSIIQLTSSIGDLNQMLLLPEWQRQLVESEKVLAANDDARRALILKLKTKYREILKGSDDNLKRAAAKQIGDSAAFGILTDASATDRMLPRARMLRKIMADLQEDLLATALKQGLAQHSALLALAKIESDPVIFAKLTRTLLKRGPDAEQILVRRHAAEALKVRSKMISLLLQASASSQDEKLNEVRREFLAVSPILIEVAVEALKDPDKLVRELAASAVQAVSDTFLDIDFMIPVREAESLGPDMLAERVDVIRDQIRQIEPVIKAMQKASLPLAQHSIRAESDLETRLECLDIIEDCVVIRRKLWTVEYAVANALRKNAPTQLSVDPLPTGPETDEVATLVVKGFTDPNPIIRKAAAQAFEFVGGQPDWRFRGTQGPQNRTVEIIAKTAINDPNMIVRWICVRSLGQTGTFPEIALPALVARLRSDDLEVRIAAAKAIKSFGPQAAPVVQDLGREISHGDADFRIAAMQTAEAIGYACKPIIPAIAENMEHENPKVRIQCAVTLGRFGSAAEAALPTLRRNLRDPDTETRLAASNAILQIEQR